MSGVAGRIAVITGAANGIGRGITEALLRGGASVAAIDVAEPDWAAFARHATGNNRLVGYRCDVADAAAVARTCREVLGEFGSADILVNDAGGAGAVAVQHVEDISDAVWRHVIDLNLTSVVNLCRELVPGMKQRGYGRIVNLSSQARHGTFGPLNTVNARLPYVAAKGALVALTKQLAKDLGPFGITCNAVGPGLILPGEDARITGKFNALPAETRERIIGGIPAGRPGTAADVAAAVLFLASQEAAFVSGETLGVTGGQ